MVGFEKEKINTQVADTISHLVLILHVYLIGWKYFLIILPISLLVYHLGHSIFMHRHLSHKQFKFSTRTQFILHLLAIISNMGKLPGYIVIHKKHHKFSGTPRDPHEWRIHGFFPIFFSNWVVYDERTDKRDLMLCLKKTPYMRFFTNYHYQILYALMPLFGGVTALTFWWKQASVILVHVNLQLKSLKKEKRQTVDTSYNNLILWPLLWGDEMHTKHHENASSEKLSAFDFQYYIGKALEKI